MQKFNCSNCGHIVYFQNVHCVRCGSPLGFLPERLTMSALQPTPDNELETIGEQPLRVHYCSNSQHGVCNWLMRKGDLSGLCRACDLNRTIPNLSDNGSTAAWAALEDAKKRLIYALMRLSLPFDEEIDGKPGLKFDFVSGAMTGHADGLITVNLAEADAVERERARQLFAEPYRSLLGHLRHESGHYYWTILVDRTPHIDKFRRLFGDERIDYECALSQYRAAGPPTDWQSSYVSAYASSHPWEDWAETWAHYLHIIDAVDTAEANGITLANDQDSANRFDSYSAEAFDALIERWVPLTLALNSLSRSMGHQDFYPFVNPSAALEKMAFVHGLVQAVGKERAVRRASGWHGEQKVLPNLSNH